MDERSRTYVSPLEGRYASAEMRELFSAQRKHSTWRRLWLALAEAERELGLDISDEQIAEMRAHLDDIDFAAAAAYEKKFRHDVMAHIHAFGDAAPKARPIIHLGATSQFVGCNTDLLQIREGLEILRGRLVNVIDALASFAAEHRALPCLGFTHFQPAQLTTVGKRAALWCREFVMDLWEIEHRLETLEFRGVKGATGTQASFLALFDGDHGKVCRLGELVAEKMGFPRVATITGQTYSRKADAAVLCSLAGAAASVHKFCNDIRLLASRREVEEPFASTQIGSSAMAYKRNPIRVERATGLARFVMNLPGNALQTAAEQWFERTLDDSANRRLAIPEAFLASDAMLLVTLNVAKGLIVNPAVVESFVRAELPFMATENVLMAAVKAGGDRQELHERIRRHSMEASRQVKEFGRANDLVERMKADEAFAAVDIDALLTPSAFIGRAPRQVDEFLAAEVQPIRDKYAGLLGQDAELNV